MRSARSSRPPLKSGTTDSARAFVYETSTVATSASAASHAERGRAAARVVHDQPEQQRHVHHAVEARVEEAAEGGDPPLPPRHHAIDQVEHPAEQHDHSARPEGALRERPGAAERHGHAEHARAAFGWTRGWKRKGTARAMRSSKS